MLQEAALRLGRDARLQPNRSQAQLSTQEASRLPHPRGVLCTELDPVALQELIPSSAAGAASPRGRERDGSEDQDEIHDGHATLYARILRDEGWSEDHDDRGDQDDCCNRTKRL